MLSILVTNKTNLVVLMRGKVISKMYGVIQRFVYQLIFMSISTLLYVQ